MKKYSKNELAEKIVGKRDLGKNFIILDEPCELGYHCPVCKYDLIVNGNYDERLTWSEYNTFLWCNVCNKDYPSCLCKSDIDEAINIYLSSIQSVIKLRNNMNIIDYGINMLWRDFYRIYRPYRKQNDKAVKKNDKLEKLLKSYSHK